MLQKMVQQMKGFPQALRKLEGAIENDLRRRHYKAKESPVRTHPVYSAIEKMMYQYRVFHTALCTYVIDMKNTLAALKAILSEVEFQINKSVLQKYNLLHAKNSQGGYAYTCIIPYACMQMRV